jgi:hypothetical protein
VRTGRAFKQLGKPPLSVDLSDLTLMEADDAELFLAQAERRDG